MDAKTYEYMNERVTKFKELQMKIKDLKERVEIIERYGFRAVYFTFNGNYNEVPYIDNDLMKETLIKLMSEKIVALEIELEEI